MYSSKLKVNITIIINNGDVQIKAYSICIKRSGTHSIRGVITWSTLSILVWWSEKPIHWKANTNQNAFSSVSWENPFLLPYYLHHKDSQNLPPPSPKCNFKLQTLYWIIEVSGSSYHVSRRKGPRFVGSVTSFKATYNT